MRFFIFHFVISISNSKKEKKNTPIIQSSKDKRQFNWSCKKSSWCSFSPKRSFDHQPSPNKQSRCSDCCDYWYNKCCECNSITYLIVRTTRWDNYPPVTYFGWKINFHLLLFIFIFFFFWNFFFSETKTFWM